MQVSSRGDPEQPFRTLCVVVPCYNEAEGVEAFWTVLAAALDRLPTLRCRVIFVDDGSTDGTLQILNGVASRDPRVVVYSLSRNFGHQVALTAGLDVANGDAVIYMDADLQHPPALIAAMVALWMEGYDVVATVRGASGAGIFKSATSRLFYWLIHQLSDTPITAAAADFALLSRRAHAALRAMPERHRFLRGMVAWIGFRRTLLPFDAPARLAGRSKYTISRMVGFAMDAVFSFSATPIKVMSRVGFVIAALGGAYLAVEVVRFVIYRDVVPGWASLMAVLATLGGLQLVAIGIIGEYLARVFDEAKRRPLYFFKQVPPEEKV